MPRGFRVARHGRRIDRAVPDRPARGLIPPPFCCNGVARLKPGVTIEQANADLERMLPIWLERFPYPERQQNGRRRLSRRLADHARRCGRSSRTSSATSVTCSGWCMAHDRRRAADRVRERHESAARARRAASAGARRARGARGRRVADRARAARRERACSALAGGVVGLGSATARCSCCSRSRRRSCRALDSIALDGARRFAFALTLVGGRLARLWRSCRAVRHADRDRRRAARGRLARRAAAAACSTARRTRSSWGKLRSRSCCS